LLVVEVIDVFVLVARAEVEVIEICGLADICLSLNIAQILHSATHPVGHCLDLASGDGDGCTLTGFEQPTSDLIRQRGQFR
jgi:hypothetical protein